MKISKGRRDLKLKRKEGFVPPERVLTLCHFRSLYFRFGTGHDILHDVPSVYDPS